MPLSGVPCKSLFRPRPALRAALLATALTMAACTPTINVHGHVPTEETLAKITVGSTSRSDVESLIGTPSTNSLFRDDVWYYISETIEKKAFFKPHLQERRIIAILFDAQNRVADVVTYTEADGKDVELVARVTPTAGNEITILQQFFGNIGRFAGKEPQ